MADAPEANTSKPSVRAGAARYDATAIFLHWATALLVAAIWLLAEAWGFTAPHSAPRAELRSLHVSLGLVLLVVLVARILWRTGPSRRPPPIDTGWQEWAARGVHLALYLALAVQVVTGILTRWGVHDPLSLFGWFTIPAPVEFTRSVTHGIFSVHGTVANLILILVGLHAAAALAHHYLWRDGTLRRMLPRRASREASGAD